jgi:hypothetical protein
MSVCPHKNCLISAALGLKNGFDFGFRIRLTHSLFYAFLF